MVTSCIGSSSCSAHRVRGVGLRRVSQCFGNLGMQVRALPIGP